MKAEEYLTAGIQTRKGITEQKRQSTCIDIDLGRGADPLWWIIGKNSWTMTYVAMLEIETVEIGDITETVPEADMSGRQ